MDFFRFRAGIKKSAVKIQPHIKYNTLSLLGKDSSLILHNNFSVKEGKKLFDIIQFNDSSSFAISVKLKKMLENNNIKGWSCFPISIEGVSEEYFAFQNLAKAGPILNKEALISLETEITEFDVSTWDGSDIFNLEGTLLNVCTTHVKELFESAKVTNIEILPL